MTAKDPSFNNLYIVFHVGLMLPFLKYALVHEYTFSVSAIYMHNGQALNMNYQMGKTKAISSI